MSARKVVIKSVFIAGLGTTCFLTDSLYAEPAQKAKAGRTVGDLLKRIEANTKKVQFNKTNALLPKVSKDSASTFESHENLAKIKPPSRSALYYDPGTDEANLEKVTNQEINQLYKLTQQFKESKRRGELWLRLAELYVEKARLVEYQLQKKFDEKMGQFQKGQTKIKPQLDLKASQEYNRKAVQLYEWFLRDFPKDAKVDQALFFLGYNYFELMQPEKGKDFYQRLTAEFPRSNYIEESNFALAEYYFDREKWQDALKYYQAVAANPRARLYSFAVYKQAWCEYKTGHVKVALGSLERVIRAGRQSKSSKDGSAAGVGRIRLATEAQKDLVVFYAEVGSAQDARGYFEEIAGSKQTFQLLEKLGYYYADVGNREGARTIFRQLIEERPMAPKAYDYQYQIVTMYTSSDKGDVYKTELYSWIQNYSEGSVWAKANGKDTELVAKANQLIETTLRNHILQQHQTAQNSRAPEAQKAAKAGYEVYFQMLKGGSHQDEMHFFYGELLFDMKDYEHAAIHYGWVAENAPKSKYYEKSVLNNVLALEKNLPKEEELKKAVDGKLEAVAFSDNVKRFEAAVDRYVQAFPKGENVPAIRYKMGALYYYHNQFDKALASFNGIIKQYPKSPYAQYAANLTLDIYNLRMDYGGLEKAGQDILNNEDLAKSQVGSQVKGVLQRASFKKAQDLESRKDFAGAAQSYEEFGRKNPTSELHLSALFNAAVNYEKAGDVGKAAEMYGLVLADRTSRNEDLKKSSSKFIASLYEKTGQYQRAAEAFEAYARKNDKDKESIDFWFNAAIIRDGMNSYNQAVANYEKYFEKSRGPDKFEAVFLEAKIAERRGNITKAQDLYKKYYDARPRNHAELIESAYRVAKIHAKKGRKSDAEDWYKKVIYQQKQFSTKEKPVGVSHAAEAKFYFVSKTYDDLRSVRIPANPAKQGQAVQEKLGMLNRLKEQLKDVIRYDDAEMVVNSLGLIGQAYQHMAAAIYGVPLPHGLDAEGIKQYKAGVDKVAKPFTEEAIKNYESAIEKGFKLEGYCDGLKLAQRELNRLNKDKFPDFGERAIPAKVSDLMGIDTDEHLGSPWKSKDDKIMVESAAQMLSKDQNDVKALNALGVFYIDQEKYGLARIVLARAEKAHPNEPAIHNNLGVVALNKGEQRQAIDSFRKALEMKKGYPIAAANLGAIFVDYKDYARALDGLEDAYGFVRSDLHRGVALDVANNYALALSGSGTVDKAKSIFQSILKAENQNPTALLNYTILLIHKLKDKSEGEKMLNRVKFLMDDAASRKRIDELEKALHEN